MTPPCDAHLVGLGGVGMSALGQLLLDQGWRISGSDRAWDRGEASDALERLARQGVRLMPQDGSGAAVARRVVVSSAIEADNPDVRLARAAGRPVLARAALLAELVPPKGLIGVAGTSGKSTTTAMLGWILAGAGRDPVVVNGACVPGWEAGGRVASVRPGSGKLWVVELDESDRSLLLFRPEHAIMTTVSADHFPEPVARALFAQFRAQVRGLLVDGMAGEGPPQGGPSAGAPGCFELDGVRFQVSMPGRHNLSNACLAVRMALALGCEAHAVAEALAVFPGVERRLQRVGCCGPSPVFDDFAHNPAKLTAVWSTLSEQFAAVAGVWRPHGYGPLRLMLDDLTEAFASVCRPDDQLWILPVYDAGGTADRSLGSEALIAELRRRAVRVAPVADMAAAEVVLRAQAAPGTALITLGARDPDLPRLARRLASEAETATESRRAGSSSA